MRFRLQTDYALRALLFMAAKKGENCTTDEIAGFFRISAAHLGRVIRRLQGYGYVRAIRGRRGGVRLNRDPATFTLGEVLEVLEQGAEPLDPPDGFTGLSPDEGTRLKAVLRRAHGLFLNYLSRVNFEELAADGLPEPSSLPESERTEEGCREEEELEPVGVPSSRDFAGSPGPAGLRPQGSSPRE